MKLSCLLYVCANECLCVCLNGFGCVPSLFFFCHHDPTGVSFKVNESLNGKNCDYLVCLLVGGRYARTA